MACGCGSRACSCQLTAGTGITITGSGSATDPYVIVNDGSLPLPSNLPNVMLPNDVGLQSWNAPVTTWSSDEALEDFFVASGVLYLIAQYVHTPFTSQGMATFLANAGTGLVAGQNFLGLYDSTGALKARTADLTSAWTGSGTGGTKYAWTAPVALAAGMYWCAFLCNAGSGNPIGVTTPQPSMFGSPSPYAFLTPAQYPTAINGSGHTSLPASIVPAGNTFSQFNFCSALY